MPIQPDRQPKVLRIGIVQNRQLVQERWIRHGETVTVGESTKNTFVLPPSKLPKRYQLFVFRGGRYALHYDREVSGKISYRNAVMSLDQLRERGDAVSKGDGYLLPLTERSRGKVLLGDITVLFQFVSPPPEPLRQFNKGDFRPKLFDEDDPVFLGFLGLFTVLAAVFVLYVQSVEPPPLLKKADVKERFAEIMLDEPAPPSDEEVPPPETEDGPGEEIEPEAEETAPEEQPEEAKPKEQMSAEEKAAREAEQKAKLEQEVMENSLLLQMIGTRGEANNGGVVADLLRDANSVGQKLDDALQGVSGVDVGTRDDMGFQAGSGEGTDAAEVGIQDLKKGGGGSSTVAKGPKAKPKGEVKSGGDEDIIGGDAGKVKSFVRKYTPRVKTCYEQALNRNPSLKGRVEVVWVVEEGKVTEVDIESTPDGQLGDCIAKSIKRWRFDGIDEAEVFYPFVLSSGG